MRYFILALLVAILLSGGCTPTIKPLATAGNSVDAVNESLSAENDGIRISARIRDLDYAPYRMVDTIASFEVTIENGTDQPYELPLSSFLLVAGDGEQYRPFSPGEVRDIVSKDSSYLIPYPYVGYYYLQDRERIASENTFESSLPFYAENHPQDIFTQALPEDMIVPEAKISGLIYFVVDLASKEQVDLRVYPGGDISVPARFSFKFGIE
ncbi:MAG: hypothetical protein C0616_09100 [Desulfuromonas sp.]|nr:MAG: hypothetical protein C0616_09100 [Desulfuromonas sp.]